MGTTIDKLASLPSLPTVAVQILKVFSDPESTVLDLVSLMQTDPALAAKVLKAANSARFCPGRSISSLQRAVLLLGKKVVCALALGFSLAEASMTRGRHARHFQQFWLQSFARALTAQAVTDRYGGCPPEDAFTVGLLSMVGRLALLKSSADEYAACLEEAEARGVPVESVEPELMSISSVELTAAMLERWNLPERFIAAVREQTAPALDADPGLTGCDLARTLRIAGAVGEFVATNARAYALALLHELTSDLPGTTPQTVDELITTVRNQLGEHAELFNIDVSRIGTPVDLLSEALAQMTELNMALTGGEANGGQAHELIQENSRLRKRISELTRDSTVDPLTSVFNRRFFSRKLQEAVDRARRAQLPIGVLLGDIDLFKQVNDTHGHLAGDDVLRKVASILHNCVRGTDIIARFGGEEFVVLVDTTDPQVLSVLGERIRAQVERITADRDTSRIPVTISIGGAMGLPTEGGTDFGERLLTCADHALYQAKSSGRNRVVICDLEPPAETLKRPLSRPGVGVVRGEVIGGCPAGAAS
jgi:two-component system cell cycle response regulator